MRVKSRPQTIDVGVVVIPGDTTLGLPCATALEVLTSGPKTCTVRCTLNTRPERLLCGASPVLLFGVLAVIPVVYLTLMYLTFTSQK